ncbi:BspA family leucine-rich repeat surface protein, partial [Candidatus Saccharibacteria bacterium]|nr:BspA family leucine-rich repeat surface protein [Candidatus Saccharibacteria bacterium]
MVKHRVHTLFMVSTGLFFSVFLSGLFTLLSSPPVSATNSASITISNSISIDTLLNETNVYNESISVDSTCSAGYNLTVATTANSNLYLNGDSTTGASITPVSTSSALSSSSNANTWGYSLTNTPDTVGAFKPLSTLPSTLKTPQETAVPSGSISDVFSVYYGVHIANTPPGAYTMENNGIITYQLTLSEDCSDSLVIDFHDNASGDTVTNLPTDEDNTYDTSNNTVTLSTKSPVRSGYTFKEWNTAADGTGSYYYPGQTVPMGSGGLSGFVDLYAIWVEDCPSGYICYDGNHADGGTMSNQEATNNSNVILIASNFNRSGYGFAGWNTSPDGTGTTYGPNATIKMVSSGGLNLYAKWLESSGTLQTWAGANSMNTGDVIALRDNRDNEVYMVSKLADNKIWTTENFRLIPGNVTFTAANTNNPTSDFISDAPGTTSTTTQCSTDDSACDDQIYFYTGNMDRTKTQQPTGNDSAYAWYSYGTMYNWYTATAGHGVNSKTSGSVEGDICPAGWHLPTGNTGGEYSALATALGGTGSAGAKNLRAYPNNFIFSGDYNPSTVIPDGRGTQGRIWTTTPQSAAKAYRMGYNSTTITPAGTWNKWDNFSVRCIYQGGNIPFSDVLVSFAGTGITSITFTNPDYGTETATVSDPVVSLVDNVTYEITAITSPGYELSSWSTSATGTLGSTTQNPTTYTITDAATLTATGVAIPDYTATVSLGAGATSVSFSHPDYTTQTVTTTGSSVLLKRGVPYTITATYEEGYTLDSWSTTPSGTIDSPTSPTTTYTISGDATLTITTKTAELLEYTLNYDASTGTGAPASSTETSYDSNCEFTIDTTTIPYKFGYHFVGYSETSGASTATYIYDSSTHTFTPSTITITSTGHSTSKTLYAVYEEDTCSAGKICYFDNGADEVNGGKGTMPNQSASSNSPATLIPSNYSKAGYGFAGWLADPGAPGDPGNNVPATPETVYGPNETITTGDLSTSGLKLYAKWVESAGNLQGWNGCNSLSQGSVTALKDTRDNNVYAVAKLKDDNCWIIENFRLDPATTTITALNTHNPTPNFITESQASGGASLSVNTMCNSNNSTCFDQLQYNTNSSNRTLTQSYNTDGNNVAWYAYGTYYNWYTATAGNGTYSSTSTSGPGEDGNVAGDLCPLGWHLPTGNTNGEYNALNTAINNGATNSDANWRKYPNNFVWSADYNNTKRNSSYTNGRIWTATASENLKAYRIGYKTSEVTASSNTYNKWDGFIIRCVKDESAAEFSDVTVTIPEGVDSITFKNSKYGEQTATSQNPVVSLAEEATYTITAHESVGYEFISWTAGSNATLGDQNQNPTTLTITDATTLTATTGTRPTYQTTVTIDEGVTSISFLNADYGTIILTPATMTDNHDGTYTGTANLYKNIEYTITGTYDAGNYYTFDTWSTTGSSTIDDATASTTTFTVTGTATLTLESKQKTGRTVLLPGEELNTKMKTLAEGKYTDYGEESSKIKTLRMADSLPSGFAPSSTNTVSVAGSEKPIYIFFDNTNDAGIMYFYTEARDIAMNPDSSSAFLYNSALTNIDGAINWDTSSVTNMSDMFWGASALTNIDGAINWDTSSVTDMSYMFSYASALTNIDGAINWDTSSVTDMRDMFSYNSALTNIDGAINWDTSSVTNMSEMFSYASALTNIDGASNWSTSSVTDMSDMFYGAEVLTNIDGARNWDTSSVRDMNGMFGCASALTNIDGAINWDTSSVTDMSDMFYGAKVLTNIDGAINWDTSSVRDMRYMFWGASALTNIDGAINWDTSSVRDMNSMFGCASALTNIDGAANWDTGSVRNMLQMFSNTNMNINGSAISNWDVRAVTATVGSSSNNYFACMFGYGPGNCNGASSSTSFSQYTDIPNFTSRSGTWDGHGTFIPDDTTSGPTVITTTVNFDSHISNIKFYGTFPGSSSSTTQIISTSGSTISLVRSYFYRITATLNSGYELALWDPSEHGKIPASRLTINSRTDDPTYFTPTGNTTLTATSQPIPIDITTTVNMDSNIASVSFCNDKYNAYNSSTETYDCVVASSNGSTVTLKQGVTYRVTTATKFGYEVSSYTATSATITSTAGPHTDFTPSGNSTLTITSTASAPTHTVAVNMDSNVSYVTFTNPDWPTRTAIRNGSTVDLRENTPYTATAYTKNGYRLSTWSTTSGGTLNSTTTNPATYTITDDATLTVTS